METNQSPHIRLTAAARTALDTLLGPQNRPVLRVFLSFLHESGPRLELAPDPPTDADTIVDLAGRTICMSSLLLDQAAPVTIDCGPGGFAIHSSLDFSEAGGNCGGACGSHH
ncbi:HesB-like domain [Desulfovibrio sp. DV]|uniref:hypothetical protein n=1 Tax=Desulfovibrio sp. DV TaxID=1844708 RepID=UPI00094BC58D|nr:hypothetical protein [Desulfovibrio sp. DV]OLN26730.1 HesB-like domain [Desulfovibrio sp. DV]